MILGSRHVSDERLLDLCVGEAGDDRDRQHVDHCPSCEGRRAEMAALLADTTEIAAAEADAVFSPERLAKQRARILHRIELDGTPGRVISFPVSKAHPRRLMHHRPAMTWVAGAAAAGLLVGVLAGHLAHDFPVRVAQEPVTDVIESTLTADEEFLSQLDMAIEGPGGVLRPLDDMTPLVWEIAAK